MDSVNSIVLKGNEVRVSVSVFLFKEGGAYIAYCPSLDLSGYDLTEDTARADFEYMLQSWLREQVENGTLRRDLALHGWKMESDVATEPSFGDILRSNQSAGRIFALPEFIVRNNLRTLGLNRTVFTDWLKQHDRKNSGRKQRP